MIEIASSLGSYRVEFCSFEEAKQKLPEDSFVITDSNVARFWDLGLPDIRVLAVTPGESSKSLQTYGEAQSWLARNGANRQSTIVALGGGVVGDLGGFVAATYMRGVALLQIPTTLLADVDSSVGGKVGIDLPEGKNLVGGFYPPSSVLVPIECLDTLPDREFRNGMAEVCKYGFIMDRKLYEEFESEPPSQGDDRLPIIVERCIRMKASVVTEDEFETTGLRAILNFGHTIGHAIEQISGYGPILHGEAISIGMIVEAELGEYLGLTEPGTAALIRSLLERVGLPTTSDLLSDPEPVIRSMRRDKKATGGLPSFSLVTEIGRCKLVTHVSEGDVRQVIREHGRH